MSNLQSLFTAVQPVSRRHLLRNIFIGGVAISAASLYTPGIFAELIKTPAQTEGPFYPDKMPLDTDNDLLIINDKITPAIGDITHLTGQVLDAAGEPLKNAVVEIWQCDSKGAYLHSGTGNNDRRDANFQGFGRFLTSKNGEYYFRTIKPIAYPGRTPHIHFKIKLGDKELLTTQCYIKGEKQNDRDGVLRNIRDSKIRNSVMVDFAPIKESKTGELAAKFDIVLGKTPESK